MDEFRQTTDPFAVWLDRNTVLEPDALIPADRLWRDYNRDCGRKAVRPISKTAFGRAIAQLRPTVETPADGKRQALVVLRGDWLNRGRPEVVH